MGKAVRIPGKQPHKKGKKPQGKSHLEETFLQRWSNLGGAEPTRQVQFHPTRKWKFDFAWEAERVAVEIHGATFCKGRHVTGLGFWGDRIKVAAAQRLNWKVFELTAADLEDMRIFIEIANEISDRRREGVIHRQGMPFADVYAESKSKRARRAA